VSPQSLVRRLVKLFAVTLAIHTVVVYLLVGYLTFPFQFRDITAEGIIRVLFDTLLLSIRLAVIPAGLIFPFVAISTTSRLDTAGIVASIYGGVTFVGLALIGLINESRPLISHLSFSLIAGAGLGWLTGVAFSIDWRRLVEHLMAGLSALSPKAILLAVDKSASEYVTRRVVFDIVLATVWCVLFFGTVGLLKYYGLLPFSYVVFSPTAWTTAFLCVSPFALAIGRLFPPRVPWTIERIARECGVRAEDIEEEGLAIPFKAGVRDWDLASLSRYRSLPQLSLFGRLLTQEAWRHLPANVVYEHLRADYTLFVCEPDYIPKSTLRISISIDIDSARVTRKRENSRVHSSQLRNISHQDIRAFVRRTLLSPDFQLQSIALQDELLWVLERNLVDIPAVAQEFVGIALCKEDGWYELRATADKSPRVSEG